MTNQAAAAAAKLRTPPGEVPGEDPVSEGILELRDPLALHHGGQLRAVRAAWRLAGKLDSPVIAALGGISAHRAVFTHATRAGWWDAVAGPRRPLDSRRCRILGLDFLGGSGETTGPASATPENWTPAPFFSVDSRRATAFPSVSTFDQARLLAHVLDHLGIDCLHAIAGASYGGMVALAFAVLFPQRVRRLLVIGAAHRSHPMATAWRCVQREIVRFALDRGDGAAGLRIARALAMATYRSPEELAARFAEPPRRRADGSFEFAVADYLLSRGVAYCERHSAEAFACLSESIDLHSIHPAVLRTPLTLVSVRQDQLVPPADMRELARRAAAPTRLVEIDSVFGHDAFLKESAQLAPIFASTLFDSPQENTP